MLGRPELLQEGHPARTNQPKNTKKHKEHKTDNIHYYKYIYFFQLLVLQVALERRFFFGGSIHKSLGGLS